MLELQVAIVLVAVGVVAVSSVLATEGRLRKRLHAGLKPSAAALTAAAVTSDDQPVVADARD
jgi:hypothetical protein